MLRFVCNSKEHSFLWLILLGFERIPTWILKSPRIMTRVVLEIDSEAGVSKSLRNEREQLGECDHREKERHGMVGL